MSKLEIDGEEYDVEYDDGVEEEYDEVILEVEFDETDKNVVRSVTEFAEKEQMERFFGNGVIKVEGKKTILKASIGEVLTVILKMGRSALKEES
jgi:hypothetical protein